MLQLTSPPLPAFLSAGEDTYEMGDFHPNRYQIGVFDLLVVIKGCLFIGEDDQRFQVQKGQSLILYPDRHHFSSSPCEDVTHFYWFHFTTSNKWTDISEMSFVPTMETGSTNKGNVFTENPFTMRLPKYCRVRNWDRMLHLCQQILLSSNESAFAWEWQQQILFQQLLQELSGQIHLAQSFPSIAVAEQAAAFLRKNYSKKVSYQELGEAVRFHPNHIARCMRSVFGCTPIEYLNRVRFEKAKLLLISTDWSIQLIAERCGFLQLSYFSRNFKKEEGLTPNQFRKQYGRRTLSEK